MPYGLIGAPQGEFYSGTGHYDLVNYSGTWSEAKADAAGKGGVPEMPDSLPLVSLFLSLNLLIILLAIKRKKSN